MTYECCFAARQPKVLCRATTEGALRCHNRKCLAVRQRMVLWDATTKGTLRSFGQRCLWYDFHNNFASLKFVLLLLPFFVDFWFLCLLWFDVIFEGGRLFVDFTSELSSPPPTLASPVGFCVVMSLTYEEPDSVRDRLKHHQPQKCWRVGPRRAPCSSIGPHCLGPSGAVLSSPIRVLVHDLHENFLVPLDPNAAPPHH